MRLTLCIFTAWLALTARGATYYVATTGSDSNPGTESQPWLTIQKAANTMTAGDTVYVQNGVYNERVESKAHGSPASPITFWGVSTNARVGAFALSHSNIVLRGFSITGTNATGYQGSVALFANANNIIIRDNIFPSGVGYVRHIYMHYTGTRPQSCLISNNTFVEVYYGSSIGLQGDGHEIVNNTFRDSVTGVDAFNVASSNTRIAGNYFTNWSRPSGSSAHQDLFQAFSSNGEVATNVVIEGNFAVNCTDCQIGNIENQGEPLGNGGNVAEWTWRNNIFSRVSSMMSIYAEHFRFYNNVFYKSGTNSGGPLLFRVSTDRGNGHNGRVLNNIFVECGSDPSNPILGFYHKESGVTNLVGDYNLFLGTGAGTSKSVTETNCVNGVSPQFVDANAGTADGFRLQASSPCISAATNLNAYFTTDFAGVTRGDTWDIGAFEYVASGGAPAMPGRAHARRLWMLR